MLGHYTTDHSKAEYMFLTKGNEIKDHFKLHSKTLAIRKVNLKEAKLIISLGYDIIPREDEDDNSATGNVDMLGKPQFFHNMYTKLNYRLSKQTKSS